MNNNSSEIFSVKNNFASISGVKSIQIIKSKIDFTPKFTIAIPTYKRANLLKSTLESAINQINFDDYDILVVDNDSERFCDTEKLLLSYDNKRISYYKNSQDIGMAGNWNRLFELAAGEYVIMLHDDDLLYHDYLDVVSSFKTLIRKRYDFMFFSYNVINELEGLKTYLRKDILSFKKFDLKVFDFLFQNILGPPVGMVANKLKFIKIGGFDPEYYPSLDYHFYIKATLNFNCCKISGYPLSVYRIFDNVSLKKETLIGFKEKDLLLKREVFRIMKITYLTFFFDSYLKVFNNRYIKYIKINYSIDDLDNNENYSYLDILIFKIVNLFYKLSVLFRVSKSIIK